MKVKALQEEWPEHPGLQQVRTSKSLLCITVKPHRDIPFCHLLRGCLISEGQSGCSVCMRKRVLKVWLMD